MDTRKAILKIAEVLDVLVGHFNPNCGGDFAEYPVVSSHYDVIYCEACEHYYQCKRMSTAREINSKLQSLVADAKSEDIYDIAYRKGFNDAYAGLEDNPYSDITEPELYGLYERGNIDGA